MIVVIDGYNVLKQVSDSGNRDVGKRTTFITQLNIYASRKGHQIIVVFDGGPYDRPCAEYHGGVRVVYSGSQQTADEYIGDYLATLSTVELLLVSSDHELCQCADDLGFFSIDSHHFYRILRDTLRSGANKAQRARSETASDRIVKLHEDTSPEFDAYMEEAARHMRSKEKAPSTVSSVGKTDKISRREQRLLKILKKL